MANVTARFENFGKATTVIWTIEESDDSWYLADIAIPADDFRLGALDCGQFSRQ